MGDERRGVATTMTAIRAVVFDIGGVLEITPPTGWMERWERELGLPPGTIGVRCGDLWAGGSTGEIGLDVIEAEVATRLGLNPQQIGAFMTDLWAEYLGTPNEELIAFARALRARVRTAILSNSFAGAREREQQAYGFEDLVELLIYSHEVGMEKPDPRIFSLTCERLGLEPGEVLFIDDLAGHVRAAQAAGLHAVVHETNSATIEAIERALGDPSAR